MQRLYHFVDLRFGLDDIYRKRVKLSSFDNLNDPFELLGVKLPDEALARHLINDFRRNNGLLCLSKAWSNPLLWSHYAERHKGFCFGFDIQDELAWNVEYVSEPKPFSCEKLISEWWNVLELTDAERRDLSKRSEPMIRAMLTTKFEGWRYEDEVRAIIPDFDSSEDGGSYKSFEDQLQLREIILGLRCPVSQAQISGILTCYAEPVSLITARQAPNSFRIVA